MTEPIVVDLVNYEENVSKSSENSESPPAKKMKTKELDTSNNFDPTAETISKCSSPSVSEVTEPLPQPSHARGNTRGQVPSGPEKDRNSSKSPKKGNARYKTKRKTLSKKPSQKSKVLPRICNAHSFEASWEERDKQRLLLALQRYGILNMKEIRKAVPGKTEQEIRTFIQIKWRAARLYLREHIREKKKNKEACLGPIEYWLECLKAHLPPHDIYKVNPLARAILFIWKYEMHPDPKECGGVDFKALYEYLYYVLRGLPPRELNQPTAKFLSDSLRDFAVFIKDSKWDKEKNFINNDSIRIKCLAGETKTEKDVLDALLYDDGKCFEELLKIPGFNPFDIPQNLLQRTDLFVSDSVPPTLNSSNATEESIE